MTLVFPNYLSLSLLGFALSTLPQFPFCCLSFPLPFSPFSSTTFQRERRGNREMQMLTTSSVHLRPALPKITKTPFSLVIPKSLSTHALGRNISVPETVQLETQKEEKRKHGDLVLYSIAPYSLVLASKLLPGGTFGIFTGLVYFSKLERFLLSN